MGTIPTETGSNLARDVFLLPYFSQLAVSGRRHAWAYAGMRELVRACASVCRHVRAFAKYTHVEVI